MALSKRITLGNGVTTNYHRVVSVDNITNVQSTIEVASYTSESKRKEESEAIANGADMNVFIETRFFSAAYDPGMTVTRAYEWLKANVADFADAEDIYDEGDGPADEVTGDEFLSMLGEVL